MIVVSSSASLSNGGEASCHADTTLMDKMRLLRLACHSTAWQGQDAVCQVCVSPLPAQSRRTVFCSDKCRRWFEQNHIWRFARRTARRRGKYACSIPECPATKADGIEVNHIIPLVGSGYGPSCFHHQANLETLCHHHHVEATNRQRAERAAKTPTP